MSAIGSIAPGMTTRIQQSPSLPPPPKADNDGDEGTESNAAKAAEAASRGGVNVVA